MDTNSPTIPWSELNKPPHLREQKFRGKAFAQPQRAKAVPVPQPAADAKGFHPTELRTAKRTISPVANAPVESKPLSECDDNPVLNEQGAAFVLGVSADLLKKWRQRKQGPDYIQYGPGGPVRYEIKALLTFRDYYRVYLSSRR